MNHGTQLSLLIELLTEELPPKSLEHLGKSFANGIFTGLAKAQLKTADTTGMRVFATPRRVAVLIPNVLTHAEDRAESKKLMPAKVAYDATGNPTTALLKKLEKEGGTLNHLERKTEGDAEYVFLNQIIPGALLATALQDVLTDTIAKLPIPKVMHYQLADGTTTVQFVRPAHALVALHGDKVLDIAALGLKADRITHGHRFQGAKDIAIPAADDYEAALAHGKVIASFDERRTQIVQQLEKKAAALQGSLGEKNDYSPLLDEVTALVEYPTVYVGEFEQEYLTVPQECLILTMRLNQKYFPLFDLSKENSGKLTNRFLIVSNMDLENPKNVIEGNQRVVRPRLADARFFFETDKKTKLADRVTQLGSIVYHNQLGTQLQRVERVRALAKTIAQKIAADAALADRAALLAKADLVTNMVGEFPELQGTMGRYYALADGEDTRVADAVEDHYKPRFSGESLPRNDIGVCVALADKWQTLVDMFSIGLKPTGDKDPFALRRHTFGVLRMLIENNLSLSLKFLLDHAIDQLPNDRLVPVQHPTRGEVVALMPLLPREQIAHEISLFLFDRLRGLLSERGFSQNEIEAVVAQNPDALGNIIERLNAVRAFSALPAAASLAAANKRVANILKKTEGKYTAQVNEALLKETAEQTLHAVLQAVKPEADAAFERGDYTESLKALAILRAPVDAFFENVMVNVEDSALRDNRLGLLATLHATMNRVADISKLAAV